MTKMTIAAAILSVVCAGAAVAQTTTGSVTVPTTTTRSPILGDPAPSKTPGTMTAQDLARADKQAPSSTNGNQPDRASAGGGGH